MTSRAFSVRLLVALAMAIATPAFAQRPEPSISVTGAVNTPLALTPAELATMPRATVATSNNGITTTYEGVLLSDVLKKA